MSDRDLYHKAIQALKDAGYELARDGRHEVWKKDGRGIAISHNIRDKHRVNSLFRSAGLSVRL